jgi:hypothetical protein
VIRRVFPEEVLEHRITFGLSERIGLVGHAPRPLEVAEGIASSEVLLAGVPVERAKRTVNDVARGLWGASSRRRLARERELRSVEIEPAEAPGESA